MVPIKEGGSGSGNFGHYGRHGLVGGSMGALSGAAYDDLSTATINQLSSDEVGAIKGYCANDYRSINYFLRHNELPNNSGMTQLEVDVSIYHISEAFKKVQPLEKDILVFRGNLSLNDNLPSLDIGDIFVDKGYVSTTALFSGSVSTRSWHFEIKIPKGSKVLALGEISHIPESEILLNRNSKFRVTNKYKKKFPTFLVSDDPSVREREQIVYELELIS